MAYSKDRPYIILTSLDLGDLESQVQESILNDHYTPLPGITVAKSISGDQMYIKEMAAPFVLSRMNGSPNQG